jgi:putative DNA primase/helicase
MADDDDVIPPRDPRAKLVWLNEARSRRRKERRAKQAEAPTEDQMALELAEVIAGSFRFVEDWGTWLYFDQTHWAMERTRLVWDLARQLCRQAAEDYDMRKLAGFGTVKGVIELVKADRRIAATTTIWDTDPWLLNTPGGTINLKTRVTYTHRASDFITKITAVAPGGACPKWRDHWKLAIPDQERRAFFRRYLGYALTGEPADCFLFTFGTGRNGRSTIINTVRRVMGSYAGAAQAATFAKRSHEVHTTELARLRSLRLVTTSENTKGARWDEEKIKQMTGGDPIVARFMRRDDFEFIPQFKLVISGNNKPDLSTVDEAMRARLLLLPFDVTIPKEKRQQNYFEQFEPELGGILQDLIDGCYEWREKGLSPPKAVTEATQEFMDAQDRTARWKEECTEAVKGTTEVMLLYASWSVWAERNGEKTGSLVAFVEALKAAGVRHSPNKGRMKAHFHDIQLAKEAKK